MAQADASIVKPEDRRQCILWSHSSKSGLVTSTSIGAVIECGDWSNTTFGARQVYTVCISLLCCWNHGFDLVIGLSSQRK